MPRILVVEDDGDLRFLYEASLSRHGYEVVAASQIADALLILTNELFDLIILDIAMPGASGIKLIEFVRDDVRLKGIPIVVVSANEGYRYQVHDLGVKHFFVKPVSMQHLIDVANNILRD